MCHLVFWTAPSSSSLLGAAFTSSGNTLPARAPSALIRPWPVSAVFVCPQEFPHSSTAHSLQGRESSVLSGLDSVFDHYIAEVQAGN